MKTRRRARRAKVVAFQIRDSAGRVVGVTQAGGTVYAFKGWSLYPLIVAPWARTRKARR